MSIKTPHYTSPSKNVAHRDREVQIGDRHVSYESSIAGLKHVLSIYGVLQKKWRLQEAGIRLLVYLCCYWETEHKPMTIAELCRYSGEYGKGNEFNVRQRVDRLLQRKLIDMVSVEGSRKYYAPVPKIVEDVRELVSVVSGKPL